MSQELADRLFGRLNEIHSDLSDKLDALSNRIAAESAKCEICRPIVLGNGHAPMDVRVDRLEQVYRKCSKILWAILGGVGTLAVGVVSKLLGLV